MRRIADRYRDFFRQADVAALVGVALVARMPFGMVGLAMLLFLREAFGSYALAGSISGVYFVAMAIGAPIQGRLIDRAGPVPTLLVTAVVHPAALLAILAAVQSGAGLSPVAVAAACAGAFAPPTNVLTRTLWRHRFTAEEDRRRAFAVDAVMIELNLTLGPALVAGLVAGTGTTVAFGVAIVVTIASLWVFTTSPALKYVRAEAAGARTLLGPLADTRLLLVFAATFGLATGIGFLEVGYPGYATALSAPALGGVFLSLSSLGSAIGGALFGGLALRAAIERQFAAAAALMTVPLALHYTLDATAAFAFVAFLAGALIAPCIACQSVLVSRLAPPRFITEAFTWSSTFIVAGLGAGMASGGWLIEAAGAKVPFLASAAAMGAVSLGALAMLRASGRREPQTGGAKSP
ncbi:MAG: MFS transporter [Betaproteobacteria bacterium]|nr:MFS transporter [Betaproteobacteria bacterium]